MRETVLSPSTLEASVLAGIPGIVAAPDNTAANSIPKGGLARVVSLCTGFCQTHNALYLVIVYINIALYATCFQLQRPLEPFLVEKVISTNGGESDAKAEYARLQSFFSIVQMIGSLATGYFLDYFSVKAGFYLSFLSSALCYWLLSKATTMPILYLSKIPTIFQAGFLCAQLAVSHSTTDGTERLAALGRLTMSYTVGTIVGPAVGGWVGASGDYYFGARLAVIGSLMSVVLTFFLPPLVHAESGKLAPAANKNICRNPTDLIVKETPSMIHIISKVWLMLFTKVTSGVAISMTSSAFPLILKNIFGFNESAMGLTMSSLSAVNSVANGILLGPFVEFLGGKTAVVVSTALYAMAAFFFLQAIFASPAATSLSSSGGLYIFIGCTFVLNVFQYVLSPALTGESTSRVSGHEKGTLLGLEHSLFAAARILTPQAGVSLLNAGGISLVSGASGAIFVVLVAVWETSKHVLLVSPAGKVKRVDGEPDDDITTGERKSK
jgi:OCT family organic cation transporter-like MFS transporter 18